MKIRYSAKVAVAIISSIFMGWVLGSLLGRAIAKPPRSKKARPPVKPVAAAGVKPGPKFNAQNLQQTYHAIMRMSSEQPGGAGQLVLKGTVTVKDANPLSKSLPAEVVYDVVATVTDLNEIVIIEEKIGEFADRAGVGNVARTYSVTYNMQPGVYLGRITVHDPNHPLVNPDGSVEPRILCMSQRRVVVE